MQQPKFPTLRRHILASLLAVICGPMLVQMAAAHHVLGRPSYSLGEDSNTPSSLQAEMQIGDYFVTYMVFPAFPKPGNPGRITLYVTRMDNGDLYDGNVVFSVQENSWLSKVGRGGTKVKLGRQSLDDGVFRQAFSFHENGNYLITATFDEEEEYIVDFPLRVGPPSVIGPLGITVGLLITVLLLVSLIQRRRSLTGKIRSSHDDVR